MYLAQQNESLYDNVTIYYAATQSYMLQFTYKTVFNSTNWVICI